MSNPETPHVAENVPHNENVAHEHHKGEVPKSPVANLTTAQVEAAAAQKTEDEKHAHAVLNQPPLK